MEELFQESAPIVEEICKKFHYETEDKPGNDSLRTVLLKLVPAMLAESSKKDRELFYQMLRNRPIVIFEYSTQEELNQLKESYMGKVNPFVLKEKEKVGEYAKALPEGAYVSEPIVDENLDLKGKKAFIYIRKSTLQREQEFWGTDINVTHLIHELGHAWNGEKDEFSMPQSGKITRRVGTAIYQYSYEKNENGEIILSCDSVSGLLLEEGMNTLAEEEAAAKYKGISHDEMKKAYRNELIYSKTNYQASIGIMIEDLMEKISKSDLKCWRLWGDLDKKEKIETLMEKTDFWKNRDKDILPDSQNPRNYENKRNLLSQIGAQLEVDKESQTKFYDFFEEYESTYFPDIKKMTPFQKIENVLEQRFNMIDIYYSMGLIADKFPKLINQICLEFYPLINQTELLMANQKIETVLEDVKLSDIKSITQETKQGMQALQLEEMGVETENGKE